MGKIGMRRQARAWRQNAALDIGDDPVGETLVLGRAARPFFSNIVDCASFAHDIAHLLKTTRPPGIALTNFCE